MDNESGIAEGLKPFEHFQQSMRQSFRHLVQSPEQQSLLGRFRYVYEHRVNSRSDFPEAEDHRRSGERPGLRAALERALELAVDDNRDPQPPKAPPEERGGAPVSDGFRQELTGAMESIITGFPWRLTMLRMGAFSDALRQAGVDPYTASTDQLGTYIVKGLEKYCAYPEDDPSMAE